MGRAQPYLWYIYIKFEKKVGFCHNYPVLFYGKVHKGFIYQVVVEEQEKSGMRFFCFYFDSFRKGNCVTGGSMKRNALQM